jgi:hypothetical protein
MTKGESRVRVSFNPGSNDKVTQIKVSAALFIDMVDELAAPAISAPIAQDGEIEKHSEFFRLKALAQTAAEEAAMWAVKAATI